MRIVQLANFHGPVSGGIRTTMRAWGSGYRSHGHEVHLIVPGARSVTRVQPRGTVHEVAGPLVPGSRGYRLITNWGKVGGLLSEIGPDVVEVSDRTTLMRAAPWAARHGARSVLVLHERLDNQLGALVPYWFPQRQIVDFWNRWAIDRFDRLVATSRYGARELLRVGALNMAHVPLGVDLDVFRPGRPVQSREIKRLLYVGRLSREKRPDLALQTLEVLLSWGNDVELVYLGDGPMKSALVEASRRLPVSFAGFVTDRIEVARALSRADVSISPCPGECFGLAALESMACGTPVVVASGSGAAELVSVGGGLAVPPNPRELALAVVNILSRPEGERRDEARALAELFPWSRSVESMLALHEKEAMAA